VEFIWIGYEGKRAGYSKMQGRPYGELFRDLHEHGISVLASMIIGFDYQTEEIIREEFEELLGLRPSMCQFLIYGPAHGTPAFERMKAEGRLDTELYLDNSRHDGFTLGFRHPHIGMERMSSIQRSLYREEFERLGPTIFRVMDDWIAGHVNLKDHSNPRLRAKAACYGANAHQGMMLIGPSRRYLNPDSARRITGLLKEIAARTGPMTWKQRAGSAVLPLLMAYTSFKLRHGIWQQPKSTRRKFRPGLIGQRSPEPSACEASSAFARHGDDSSDQ
jgi:hypothetical protein